MYQLPRITLLVLVWMAVCFTACQPVQHSTKAGTESLPLELWYPNPAENWNQALPIGNGRLGAMVFGGIEREILQLNEDTVWAGGPNNNINPALAPYIQQVADLVMEGDYQAAQALADEKLHSTNQGMPYQTLGRLLIDAPIKSPATDYRRSLDINQAVAYTRYQTGDTVYQRESFAALSAPAILTQIKTSRAGGVNLDLHFDSAQTHKVTVEPHRLRIDGKGGDHEGVPGQVRFTLLVQPVLEGGQLTATDTGLAIRNADKVTLYTTVATNFVNYRDLSANPVRLAEQYLSQAMAQTYEQLRDAHIAAYQSQFHRVSLKLGQTPAAALPTDQRVKQFSRSADPALAALYFQFGRYLLISSSQPGSQPANLQGIWNPHITPPWDSKYTVNINTEMNYWPAEPTNLSELHEPLFAMLKDLAVTGRESARQLYNADGWMMHHNTDVWRITGQVDGPFWGQWLGGGAWLSQHIGYRYHYTGDVDFLREYYPVLREAARFYVANLRRDNATGWLLVVPSNSPENNYLKGDGNIQTSITAGSTIDNQLVFDLFSLVIEASTVLDEDVVFATQLKSLREQLPPMQIGRHGQLQEWLHDWDSPEDKHRHVSHLYGFYPGNQISPYRTPELFSAVRTTLEQRGDASTGWSMGWKVNLWARLQDGNRAYKLLTDQLSLVTEASVTEAGGTYPNLLDAHPPFQIDGNFGVATGIAEMLVQSYDGAIHVLPALPDAWPDGAVKGLVTRGGFEVDIVWRKGQLHTLTVYSRTGGTCRLRLSEAVALVSDTALMPVAEGTAPVHPLMQVPTIAAPVVHNPDAVTKVALAPTQLVEFMTQAGQRYVFEAK